MLVSAAWLVPAVFAALDQYAQTRLNDWGPFSLRDMLFSAGDWFLYAFLTPGVFAISRRWPLARPHLARRVWLHLGLALLFCVAWATAGKILQFALGYVLTPDQFHAAIAKAGGHYWSQAGRAWLSWVFTTFPFGVAVYLCMVGIEHATRYFIEAREREVQLARVSEQLAGAKLAALQARVNPHFLFNSLNTINVLVRDGDRAQATRVIEQLSEVLRTTLGRSHDAEVSLDDELTLVKQYLAVEQARFSDRLHVELDVDASLLSAAVPSFSVQHLVENAVRHGIARRSDAGWIAIAARRDGGVLEVSVADDGAGVGDAAIATPGHGLSNTRERLHTLYGGGASLDLSPRAPHGTIARMRVPYHEVLLEATVDAGA
jgi:sensor histidine kinase YesM